MSMVHFQHLGKECFSSLQSKKEKKKKTQNKKNPIPWTHYISDEPSKPPSQFTIKNLEVQSMYRFWTYEFVKKGHKKIYSLFVNSDSKAARISPEILRLKD